MPEIQMPKLSDTMTEGTLVAWKKKKGDKVSAGDVIAEIETDKATMEWESPDDGTLTEIYVEEGGKVEVGQRIAFIGEEGEAAPKEEKKAPEKKPEAPKKEEAKTSEEPKRATEKPAPAKAKERETTPPQEPMEGRAASQTLARGRARGENRRRRAGESIARGATDRGRARRRSCECERNRPGRPGNRDRCARCFEICSRGRRPR